MVGGRLAYFLPVVPDLYSETDVPTHPSLRVVSNSEQLLSGSYRRARSAPPRLALLYHPRINFLASGVLRDWSSPAAAPLSAGGRHCVSSMLHLNLTLHWLCSFFACVVFLLSDFARLASP